MSFEIKQQPLGTDCRHTVVGDVGARRITVLATSLMQACEIARCLNEAAAVEVEDLVEQVSADELHGAMEEILRRQSGALEVTPEEEAAWLDFDARR